MKNLYERLHAYLKLHDPELIKYVVEMGQKENDDNTESLDFDNFKIEVEFDEITVIYGCYHDHFGYPDEDEFETFKIVQNFCREILSEKYIAVYLFDSNEKLIKSSLIESGKEVQVPASGSVKVRSFKGTYNR